MFHNLLSVDLVRKPENPSHSFKFIAFPCERSGITKLALEFTAVVAIGSTPYTPNHIMASDSPRRPTCSFLRRRRVLLIPALLFAFFLLFSTPWSLPPLNLSEISSSLSRANIVSLVKVPPVDEIYGLLHFVTSDDDRMLSYSVNVDPVAPIDLTVYLAGDQPDWKSHVRRLREEYPLIVFSKTYCPYSRKAKKLLEMYNLSPPPLIIEVDLRDDGDFIKLILTRLTDHSTFPNIILNGQGLGGNDDLHTLRAQGKLKKMFESAGMTVREDIVREQETQ